MSAKFRAGDPIFANYTPTSGNVAAGQVVILGNTAGLTCGIAHQPIERNTLGAVAVGGGVYEVINLNNAANYAKVYWDAAAQKVTTLGTGNPLFGFIVSGGGGGANSVCLALHMPYV